MTYAATIAEFALGLRYEDLPDDVVTKVTETNARELFNFPRIDGTTPGQ